MTKQPISPREDSHRNYNKLRDTVHGILRKASVSEENKSIVFAGCLLALQNKTFREQINKFQSKELGVAVIESIELNLKEKKVFENESTRMIQFLNPFNIIASHNQLNRIPTGEKQSYLGQLLSVLIDSDIISVAANQDVLADFYTEFLRWSGGDGSGLGIVLTPKHITDLFALLGTKLVKSPVVLDTSFGGGSFLRAGNELGTKIVGIELNPKMYSLGATSLILGGASISNLLEGDCFNKDVMGQIKSLPRIDKPNLGLINPPYSLRKNGGKSEIEFIENACNLVDDGYVFALVPISTGAGTDALSVTVKRRILERHSLYAVMSMPVDLFTSKAGTMVQILVFRTNHPHTEETWFADWSDDGFILQKHVGREDFNGVWETRKKEWIDSFKARKTIQGKSLLKKVNVENAWVTEEFLTKNIQNISSTSFIASIRSLKNYEQSRVPMSAIEPALLSSTKDWKEFPFVELFKIHKGDFGTRGIDRSAGTTPLVTATATNNGISDYVMPTKETTLFPASSLTINQNGSVGYTYYQPERFVASSDVAVLEWIGLPFTDEAQKRHVLLFISTILQNITRGRFHYGFKLNNQRLRDLKLPLPVKNGTINFEAITAMMTELVGKI